MTNFTTKTKRRLRKVKTTLWYWRRLFLAKCKKHFNYIKKQINLLKRRALVYVRSLLHGIRDSEGRRLREGDIITSSNSELTDVVRWVEDLRGKRFYPESIYSTRYQINNWIKTGTVYKNSHTKVFTWLIDSKGNAKHAKVPAWRYVQYLKAGKVF